ncbi:Hpt domain-containing protein [Galbibacter pacificus]|uniref:Response regulatory domain-containing protein n=1 Tax=Galbibacter pacificus TaxID=2996052 RepID=A0ABT6FS43_9FLAO|nr:hypothetical protein [Galbibacter pacificus]MDG3582821.1 hypothetical protein [Galbibacter pacificus]MDG3586060.1 hypothetical protein [Galbibacter pacificus]
MSKQLHILLITSNQSDIDRLSVLCVNYDWIIESSKNSFQAIQKIKDTPSYNFLIIDHEVGPLTSIQLLDYLSMELNLNMPAVLITEKEVHGDLNNEEPFFIINKPITEKDIMNIVSFVNESSENLKKGAKPYSLNYLKQLSDNNTAFILESLQIFKDSVYTKLNELKQAVKNLEFKTAREIAHNIKPSFEMLENDHCRVLCDKICYQAKDEEISALAEKLNQEYLNIIDELKKEFPKLN